MKKKLSKLERFAIKYGLTTIPSTYASYDLSIKGYTGLVPHIDGDKGQYLEAFIGDPEQIFVHYDGINVQHLNTTEEELRILAKSICIDVSYHRLAEAFHDAEISKRKTK